MQLYKAHGTGNDFVVLPDPDGVFDLTAEHVVALCDRRTGIGADGVLRLAPSEDGHVFMDYRNGGDGAAVEMCGNGVRVVAAHLVEHGWTDARELAIDTRDGVKRTSVRTDGSGRVVEVTVDMGPPRFADEALPFVGGPTAADGTRTVTVDGEAHALLTVSMGNPHAVLLTDDPATAPVTTLGPALEHADAFPAGTNVEFVAVRDAEHLDLRVWERGVGETQACGTGVCGAVAALVRVGRVRAGADVAVTVPGGLLRVRWDGGAQDPVWLTGPAEEVAVLTLTPSWLDARGLPALAVA